MIALILFTLLLVGFLAAVWLFVGQWGVFAYLVGLAIYMTAPFLVSIVSSRAAVRLSRTYINNGFRFVGRCLLVAHKHGGFSITGSRFDPDYGMETGVVNGRRGYWEDPYGAMSSLATAGFGIVTDHLGVILDLRVVEVASRFDEMIAAGEHTRVKEYTTYIHAECGQQLRQATVDAAGEAVDAYRCPDCDEVVAAGDIAEDVVTRERQYAKYLNLAADMVPVDVRDAVRVMPGKADPFSAEVGEEYGKNSLELFGQQFSGKQMLTFLIFFGVGAVVMWFAGGRTAGGGTGSPDNESGIIPIVVDAIGLLPGVVL